MNSGKYLGYINKESRYIVEKKSLSEEGIHKEFSGNLLVMHKPVIRTQNLSDIQSQLDLD
jgi:hypothetical protein